jgi:hypothetical protein
MIINNINNHIYIVHQVLSRNMCLLKKIILPMIIHSVLKFIILNIIKYLYLFFPGFEQKKLRIEPIFDIIKLLINSNGWIPPTRLPEPAGRLGEAKKNSQPRGQATRWSRSAGIDRNWPEGKLNDAAGA